MKVRVPSCIRLKRHGFEKDEDDSEDGLEIYSIWIGCNDCLTFEFMKKSSFDWTVTAQLRGLCTRPGVSLSFGNAKYGSVDDAVKHALSVISEAIEVERIDVAIHRKRRNRLCRMLRVRDKLNELL